MDKSRVSDLNSPFNLTSPLTPAPTSSDRRYAYSRQPSFHHQFAEPRTPTTPFLSRSVSSIDIPPPSNDNDFSLWSNSPKPDPEFSAFDLVSSFFRVLRTGNRHMKRLAVLISLNVAYSTAELLIGLLSDLVGLISDAFHLTFGCGLLTFSLFAMAASRRKPDRVYT